MSRSSRSPVAVTVVAAYAANYVLTTLCLHQVSPFLMLTIRFALSAAILWPMALLTRRRLPVGRVLGHAIGAGLLVQGAQFVGTYWAVHAGVGAGFTALVIAMNPVVTAVLTALVLRRPDSALGVGSVIVGAAAVIIACVPRIIGDARLGPAIIAVVAAMLGLAVGSLWQAQRLGSVDPISFTAIGVTASLPVSAALIPFEHVIMPEGPTWFLVVAVAAIGVVGTVGYASLVRSVGARSASVVFAVIPAATALIAGLVLGEPVTVAGLLGLIAGAAAWAMRFRARPAGPEAAASGGAHPGRIRSRDDDLLRADRRAALHRDGGRARGLEH
ncbi:DMT family transporter [Microbacterium gorillae]|uniref:DMT family transporter n=1 Tax=Microbacterium gorillae TaxID=1231063 RepID=UPI00058FC837|nr:DMT family transporter [Microbacterium gorillae]